ncbi:unnamed protein product [Dovyalis caffra]|uniref:GTD-binding domain-containing protein n=1 Tax=Dovyalis caffra TaxID=77055 RepID=A0AAV1R872_9ROSI|nr:unnamed protein product [Dovyalis caffra]
MQILGCVCLLVVICSVLGLYKGILQAFLGLFLMDCVSCLKVLYQHSGFKGGFLVFRYVSPVFKLLWLFLMFCLGLRFLQFTWHGKGLIQFLCGFRAKSSDPKNGFGSKLDFGRLCDSKILSCTDSSLDLLGNSKAKNEDNSLVRKKVANDGVLDDDCERERSVEDEEYDVIALRRLVKIERLRADMAYAELEKERMATASAADEAMAMILRLQNEKSSAEIEAKQYRQLAEQKQEFQQEVMESLQWDIIKLESERSELEENLRLLREKLRQYVKSDEVDQFEGFGASTISLCSTMDDGIKNVPNISLDYTDTSVL